MLIEFKKYGFYQLDYLVIGQPAIFTQSNYHYSWGVSASITGWNRTDVVKELDKNCLIAAWHLKGTHQFNNSL